MVRTIILGSKKRVDRSIAAQLERRRGLPAPLRFITSPLLTTGLAGVLGTLLGGPVAGIKTAAFTGGLISGTTFLATSPTTRKALKEKALKPAEFGAGGGVLFETALEKGKEVTRKVGEILGKIPTPLKRGAAAAAIGGAAIAGGAAILPRIRERFRDRAPVGLPPAIPTQAFEPLAPVQQPVEEKPMVIEAIPQPKPVQIKNIFKPSIDISFRKSKKFINQQINV